MVVMPVRRFRVVALAGAFALALAGCGQDATTAAGAQGDSGSVQVSASFYPLQFAAERVGGERVTVTSLTKPGAEPHDLELAPRDVAALSDADLLVYLSGFQPAVDDALTATTGVEALDVKEAADLSLTYAPDDHSDDHVGDQHATEDGSAGGTPDPHFWLDPLRLAAVGNALAARLAEVDPDGADTYAANARTLTQELTALDGELTAGLASCAIKDLVTSHDAFGYLADRYGFTQVGISGLSPDDEPDPRELAELAGFVREHGVTTVYSEVLVSPAIAETVARETGASTAVLDPLEGITDASAGDDYLQVMAANLQTLRTGQSCA
jgi:zinc transport system substrate-binding protein